MPESLDNANIRPVWNTEEMIAAKNRLYRFWDANRKQIRDDWYKSDLEDMFRNDAFFATIGSVLFQAGLVTPKEWDRLRSDYFRKNVEAYIDEQTAKLGLKRVD